VKKRKNHSCSLQETETSKEGKEPFISEEKEESFELMPNIIYSVVINDAKNGHFKNEIIQEIKASESLSKEDERIIGNYEAVKFSNIKAFYNPDNIKIDRYEMYKALLLGGSICYYYAPVDTVGDRSDFCFSDGKALVLQFKRFDYEFGDIPSPATIERLAEVFKGKVIDKDMAYAEGQDFQKYHEFVGLIGETWFDIKAPKSMDSDTLIKLGRQVIDTAELVNVQAELDAIKQRGD